MHTTIVPHDPGLTLEELMETSYALSPLVLSVLKDCFSNDYTVEEACREARISKDSYYQWVKKSDEFADEMERAKDDLFVQSKRVLAVKVKQKGDENTAKWLLERRRKRNYAARTELTDGDGEAITIPIASESYLEFIKQQNFKKANVKDKK